MSERLTSTTRGFRESTRSMARGIVHSAVNPRGGGRMALTTLALADSSTAVIASRASCSSTTSELSRP